MKYLYAGLACFLFLNCLFSCKEKRDTGIFEAIFRQADSLNAAGAGKASLQIVDSFFLNHPAPEPYWLYRKFLFRRMYYYYEKVFDSSDLYTDSMLYALEHFHVEKKYPAEYDMALDAKGDYYYERNNLNKAFEYYYKSKMAAREGKDTCGFGNHSYHLGMVTYKQEKYLEALSYFRQSLEENAYCRSTTLTFYRDAELLNNIALCFYKTGQPDSALGYYGRGLALLEAYEKENGHIPQDFGAKARGVIYGNIAKILIAEAQPDSAETLLKKSIELNRKPGNENKDARLSQVQLAELYMREDKPVSALLQDIGRSLDSLPDVDAELRWRKLMFQYYQKRGEANPAITYLHDYIRLKDSIADNSAFRQTDVNQLMQFSDAQYQLNLLTKDNELRQLYFWLTMGFSLMAFVIVLLIYANYRRSKKTIQLLTALNKRINIQKKRLESAMAALRQSNLEKDRIMRVVAHDLRGPVGGIVFIAEKLLRKTELEESKKQSLGLIKNTSTNSMNLIGELLEKNSQAGDMKEDGALDELVSQAVKILQFKAAEKEQTLEFKESGKAVNVFVDPGKISRVLNNIITNAIKFSQPGSLIQLWLEKKEGMAVVAVKDQGIGIPEELQPFIFDMVSAAKRSGTQGEKSYGLGLSISREIIESSGGEMWFETREGEGTVFYFSLPITESPNGIYG